MKKIMAVSLALALAFTTVAWAGNGPQNRAKSTTQNRICLQQKSSAQPQYRMGQPKGNRYGPGDGTGNLGIGPGDGTGYGRKAGIGSGTGTCDGQGPHGKAVKAKAKQGPGS